MQRTHQPPEHRHIFILHTPYQLQFAKDLIEQYAISQPILIIEGKELNEQAVRLFQEQNITETQPDIVAIDLIRPSDLGKTNRRRSDQNKRRVLDIIKSQQSATYTIYISDINWPINNHVYFQQRGRSNIYLIEDGIGSYLNSDKTMIELCRGIIRWLAHIVGMGPDFRPYMGKKMGEDQPQISGSYLRAPQHSPATLKKMDVPFRTTTPASQKNIPNNALVFLEQPYWDNLGVTLYQKIINDFFTKHRRNKGKQILKIHHLSKQAFSHQVETILDTEPIENFSIGTNVTIGALTSSALFNLKLIHGSNIHCIAIMHEKLPGQKNLARLRALYDRVGVEIIE